MDHTYALIFCGSSLVLFSREFYVQVIPFRDIVNFIGEDEDFIHSYKMGSKLHLICREYIFSKWRDIFYFHE